MSVSSTTTDPRPQAGRLSSLRFAALATSRAGSGVVLAGAVLAGAAVAPAGAWALAALALAGFGLAAATHRSRTAPSASPTQAAAPLVAATQSGSLTRQVVPVWRRNVDGARAHAEHSMSALVESFASVASHLDEALKTGAAARLDSNSIDELMAQHRPELDLLLASTREVVSLKDELLKGVAEVSDTLEEMTHLSKEVQTISRATHLLALNASVEAQHATVGGAGHGFGVVAQEVRQLADQSRDAGAALGKHLLHMQDKLRDLRRRGARLDTDEDELSLSAEQNARAVISALLRGIEAVTRSQRSLHSASHQVQTEVEQILVSLQSQDRMSQMLTSVTDDMSRLQAWLEGAHDEAAVSANRWLERLESSYTMEEMRASHHDTVKVEQAAEVEFF